MVKGKEKNHEEKDYGHNRLARRGGKGGTLGRHPEFVIR